MDIDPPWIVCSLCYQAMPGFRVGANDKYFPEQEIIEESEDWLQQQSSEGYVFGNASDLYKMHFKKSWIWSRFYRVVYQERQYGSFKLSGVTTSTIYDEKWFQAHSVPKDPNKMVLGCPSSTFPQFIKVRIQDLCGLPAFVGGYASGFAMHERCWSMMIRILPEGEIQKHLDIFVDRCLEKDPTKWYIRNRYMGNREPRIDDFRDPLLDDSIFKKLEKLQKSTVYDSRRRHRSQERRAVLSKQRHKKSKLRKEDSPILTPQTPPHLPGEIVLRILELLEKPRYIEATLKVFPAWEYVVPQRYWRTRWINDHEQEYQLLGDLLPSNEDLDWRPFCLYFNRNLVNSQAWTYRQDIMARLQKAKSSFLAAVAKRESPSSR